MVAYDISLEVRSISRLNNIVVTDAFNLKTLEQMTVESSEVKERLKHQGEKTSKIEGLLGEIL